MNYHNFIDFVKRYCYFNKTVTGKRNVLMRTCGLSSEIKLFQLLEKESVQHEISSGFRKRFLLLAFTYKTE